MNVAGTDTGPSNHICAVRWWQSKEGGEEIKDGGEGGGGRILNSWCNVIRCFNHHSQETVNMVHYFSHHTMNVVHQSIKYLCWVQVIHLNQYFLQPSPL